MSNNNINNPKHYQGVNGLDVIDVWYSGRFIAFYNNRLTVEYPVEKYCKMIAEECPSEEER